MSSAILSYDEMLAQHNDWAELFVGFNSSYGASIVTYASGKVLYHPANPAGGALSPEYLEATASWPYQLYRMGAPLAGSSGNVNLLIGSFVSGPLSSPRLQAQVTLDSGQKFVIYLQAQDKLLIGYGPADPFAPSSTSQEALYSFSFAGVSLVSH